MRLLIPILALGAVVGSTQQGWMANAVHWWRDVAVGQKAAASAAALDGQVVTRVLAARQRQGAPPLAPDLELQELLLKRLQDGGMDADDVVNGARLALPQYEKLGIFQSHCATSQGLLDQIAAWPNAGAREFNHIAAVTEPAMFGLGWSATVLVGQRLPMFSPEAISGGAGDRFYTVCNLCSRGQICQIPRHTRSLSLECPECHRVYAMLAADKRGRFRYVNEFLTGYAPPAKFPKNQAKLDELMTIWRSVAGGCQYTMDAGNDENDAWQTALETQTLGKGDCEDSSILLADWLVARDFQARVALGRYAERGGHAWVVVRLDGTDYLLESTEGASRANRPPLLAEVGSRYVPELLFDHMAFFIRRQPTALWSGDFWGNETWERVVPRSRYSSDGKLVTQAN